MKTVLHSYSKGVDHINEWLGKMAGWLTTFLMILIVYDVINRYLFNYSNPATFELEWHLFAIIFLMGAGYTLKHDRHVRVDVFYANFSEKQKAWVNLTGTVLFLIPFCLIVIKGGIPYVEVSYNMNEKSTDPGGLPFRYAIKSVIIIGFFFLLLQGTSSMAKSILTLLGEKKT
ncbi:TRAP transporter small permease subunit [Rapidithrix thailandica]|uniref:TRAP transporter small permease subunit n=1 Tax=Rapidithrix thailandica TaxID=413964 RepID=A0AAW9SAK3_9BACT